LKEGKGISIATFLFCIFDFQQSLTTFYDDGRKVCWSLELSFDNATATAFARGMNDMIPIMIMI